MKKGIVLSQIVCLPLFLIVMLFLVPIKASAISQTVKLNYDEINGMLSFETTDSYYYSLFLSSDGGEFTQLIWYGKDSSLREEYAIRFINERFSGVSGTYEFQVYGFTDNNIEESDLSKAVVESNSIIVNYERPGEQLDTPILAEPKIIEEESGDTYVFIEWSPVENASSYDVRFNAGSFFYSSKITDNFDTQRIALLDDGVEFEIQVMAYSNNVKKYRDSEYAVVHKKIKVDSSQNVYLGGNKAEPETKAYNYSQVRLFVNRLYKTTMGRNGDSEGLEYWTEHLLAGDLTGAQAAKHFILADEFIGKNLTYNEFLDVMYAAFFDRPKDDQGYYYWLDQMYNGATREYIVACFVDSEEFTGICDTYGIERGNLDKNSGKPTGSEGIVPLKVKSGNVNDTKLSGYVEKLYTTILGRASEPAGCEYWKNAIKEGNEMDAAKAASQFFQSKEYKDKNKSDEEFLKDVYAMFFGREPDNEGYNYWLENLKKEKVSRVWLIEAGFGKSEEFKGILESYGFDIEEE